MVGNKFNPRQWSERAMMDKKAFIETLKSFLRGVYFTVLGLVGTFITSLATNADLQNKVIHLGSDVYLPIGVVIVAVLAGLAKLIDRYVHTNDNIKLNGITPTDLLDR